MIAAAALALVLGLILNATLVPGSYEWLGLFRIFGEVSHRSGFWVLCLLVWLAGVRNAPAERHQKIFASCEEAPFPLVWAAGLL
jgi:hypothetical protein